MFSAKTTIADFDPELWAAMAAEQQRQEDHIELIASENYTSPLVMQAQGVCFDKQICRRLPRQALLRWL